MRKGIPSWGHSVCASILPPPVACSREVCPPPPLSCKLQLCSPPEIHSLIHSHHLEFIHSFSKCLLSIKRLPESERGLCLIVGGTASSRDGRRHCKSPSPPCLAVGHSNEEQRRPGQRRELSVVRLATTQEIKC